MSVVISVFAASELRCTRPSYKVAESAVTAIVKAVSAVESNTTPFTVVSPAVTTLASNLASMFAMPSMRLIVSNPAFAVSTGATVYLPSEPAVTVPSLVSLLASKITAVSLASSAMSLTALFATLITFCQVLSAVTL